MRASSVEKLILEFFEKQSVTEAHFTALEVYQQIKPRLPAVNSSTVYRALERMTHAGKISVSDMGRGAAVYSLVNGKLHHHLICNGCNKVITVGNEIVQPFFDTLSKRFKHKIVTNHLVLFGYCESCQKDQKIQSTKEST